MRCKTGDEVTVIDGNGRSYLARISGIQKKDVSIDIVREVYLDTESPGNLILCQGILKGEKMDIVVQKATELGVKEIIPLVSERCQVKETRKTNRWRKIAGEAAEQCGRAVIPAIHEPRAFTDFFGTYLVTRAFGGLWGLIFWEGGGTPLNEAVGKIELTEGHLFLCVGPEGGFSLQEIEMAESRGFIRTTLGRRILRAETAAVAAVALVQFLAEKSGSGRESLI